MSEKKRPGHAQSRERKIDDLCTNVPAITPKSMRAMRACEKLDLTSTKNELVRKGIFTEEQAEEIERYYRTHLLLISGFPNAQLAPADQVGEFWHTHILETEKYLQDCEAICGRPIHHRFEPEPGTDAYQVAASDWESMVRVIRGRLPNWFTYTGETR